MKRDLYCFKSGKLELSILDEDLEEEIKETLAFSNLENQMTYIPLDQEETCAYSQEDDQETNSTSYPQAQLIITEEISHTLKTMSGFLMQTEGMELENTHDEMQDNTSINAINVIKDNNAIESIRNASENTKEDTIQENKEIGNLDIKDTEQPISKVKVHQDERAETDLSRNTERVVNMQNMKHHINSNTALQQKVIDDILLSHFGEITAKFPYEKELKQKIEKQIYKIRSYK